jgi:hypothetical protein
MTRILLEEHREAEMSFAMKLRELILEVFAIIHSLNLFSCINHTHSV